MAPSEGVVRPQLGPAVCGFPCLDRAPVDCLSSVDIVGFLTVVTTHSVEAGHLLRMWIAVPGAPWEPSANRCQQDVRVVC